MGNNLNCGMNMQTIPTRDMSVLPTKDITLEDILAWQNRIERKKQIQNYIGAGFFGCMVGYLVFLLIGLCIAGITNDYRMLYFAIYFR